MGDDFENDDAADSMHGDDGLAEALRKIPPADIHPRAGVTPEVVELLREHAGETVTVHWPDDPVEDAGEFVTMPTPRIITATLLPFRTPKEIENDDDTDPNA